MPIDDRATGFKSLKMALIVEWHWVLTFVGVRTSTNMQPSDPGNADPANVRTLKKKHNQRINGGLAIFHCPQPTGPAPPGHLPMGLVRNIKTANNRFLEVQVQQQQVTLSTLITSIGPLDEPFKYNFNSLIYSCLTCDFLSTYFKAIGVRHGLIEERTYLSLY